MEVVRLDLETVVMSATPPYSAGFRFSLILISSIALKEGKSSESAAAPVPFPPGPTELMPSIVTESCEGRAPPTIMLPPSVCTPGCAVSVEKALVEPWERVPIATGRSVNSRLPLVSAMLDASVCTTAIPSTVTVVAWVATFRSRSICLVSLAVKFEGLKLSLF